MITKDVVAKLDSILLPLGFSRKKATWNRPIESIIDVLDIQVSKTGDTLTLNAGVLDRDIYLKFWNKQPDEFVEESSCIVRARIGQLIDNKDKWWQVASDEAAEEIIKCVVDYVLPFFERMRTLQGMNEWLSEANVAAKKYPPPIIYLAIIKHRLGCHAEACALLGYLRANTGGAWKTKTENISERLGCH